MSDQLFLKSNVRIEPLVDQWYAWPHLISPATAARNIVHRHMPIMDSYIRSPAVHAAATKSPAMLGGPFMNYDGEKVAEVTALRDSTLARRSNMLALSRAIDELTELLLGQAKGFSLASLYSRVPDILSGYVELVYDLNNHPSFRLFEPLLYRSEYYDAACQSVRLATVESDRRPFILSTPRLPGENDVCVPLPFAHPGSRALFGMSRTSQSLGAIKDVLGADSRTDGALLELFTEEAPGIGAPYAGPGVRCRYWGHACMSLETPTCSVWVDPAISYPGESEVSRYTLDDLPPVIDYVLLTHNHQDHVLLETLLRLRDVVRHVVVPRSGRGELQDPSLKLMLEHIGFENVIELGEMEELETPAGSIMGLPFLGEHGDLSVASKMMWRVVMDDKKVIFAADCCNLSPPLYRQVQRWIGDTDVMFVGMECDGAPTSWIYGPLFSRPLERGKDQSRRLAGSGYEQAIELVRTFRCERAYVYAMGQEPWLNFITSTRYTEQSNPIVASNRLVEECRANGIESERLFGMKEIIL